MSRARPLMNKPPTPHDELTAAYREGRNAARDVKPASANPYPKPDPSESLTKHSEWKRGWIAGYAGR